MKVGDICEYYFDNGNKSKSIVQIEKMLYAPSSGIYAEIKFLDVIEDDSGNGMFTYLLKTGKTMHASLEYLHKIKD